MCPTPRSPQLCRRVRGKGAQGWHELVALTWLAIGTLLRKVVAAPYGRPRLPELDSITMASTCCEEEFVRATVVPRSGAAICLVATPCILRSQRTLAGGSSWRARVRTLLVHLVVCNGPGSTRSSGCVHSLRTANGGQDRISGGRHLIRSDPLRMKCARYTYKCTTLPMEHRTCRYLPCSYQYAELDARRIAACHVGSAKVIERR